MEEKKCACKWCQFNRISFATMYWMCLCVFSLEFDPLLRLWTYNGLEYTTKSFFSFGIPNFRCHGTFMNKENKILIVYQLKEFSTSSRKCMALEIVCTHANGTCLCKCKVILIRILILIFNLMLIFFAR